MNRHNTFIASGLRSAVRNRELIIQLIWREVLGRYRGSFAGLVWSFLNPLFFLCMYTFVFGVVFRARWGGAGESTLDFSLFLFAGLIVHGLLAECINRAPFLILGNPGYVKQVVFPLEVLPIVALGSALFHGLISLVLLIAIWAVSHGELPASTVFIPFLLAPLCLLALGLGWMLSSITVYFRDLGQIVGFISSGLLFLSPVFYPTSAVPEPFRGFLQLNPLTYIIESLRNSLSGAGPTSIGSFIVYLAASAAFAALGYAVFQKTRNGFADVI
jgi:ABC-type polysaccharide/polyol phosphate export systems, permease component